MARIHVQTPAGAVVQLDGDFSVEQIRDMLTSAGIANLAGAPAVETVREGGDREVTFSAASGTTKG